jgi:CheY-like chemotaxis protein
LKVADKVAVLVVEDEPLLLMEAVDIVESAGFEALAAENADEALAVMEKHQGVRVVFTDINMPGSMDGTRMAATIAQKWPPVRFIFASGNRVGSVKGLPEGSRFFAKPYRWDAVAKAIREVLST